ncbi:MAG: sulfate reduction electron transfer complex DsrMKJOP subunit DsrO [Planctomycetota bacterium]
MDQSRRTFLRTAGIAVLGISGGGSYVAARAIAAGQHDGGKTAAGVRYALAIDTQKCAAQHGCTACITACHAEHNVPAVDVPEREIKWIWKEEAEHALHEYFDDYTSDELRRREIPVLCNHCDNPPCVRVCPTQATYKRADGPVMMDMHRCIGCRYCVVGCPYGARSFNYGDPREFLPNGEPTNARYPTRSKGVVEKCTLCTERLARGLRPACVEACPAGAMLFGDLEDPGSEIRAFLQTNFTVRRKAEVGTRPHVHYKL